MNTITKHTLASFMLALMLAACQKDRSIAPDPAQVIFDLRSPRSGQVFRSGDTVSIDAALRYPGQLHGYSLQLVDSATQMVLFDVARHIHSDSFRISEHWISAASDSISVRLRITANINHDGQQAQQTRSFSVIP